MMVIANCVDMLIMGVITIIIMLLLVVVLLILILILILVVVVNRSPLREVNAAARR